MVASAGSGDDVVIRVNVVARVDTVGRTAESLVAGVTASVNVAVDCLADSTASLVVDDPYLLTPVVVQFYPLAVWALHVARPVLELCGPSGP